MAFNFNWLPLDTSSNPSTSNPSSAFYDNAKSLLTAALNKSEKPPIIVDDIVVEDLNLGASAPDLEILEIGDIAEDRFRGIFRMSYCGDAKLRVRTKVQANPLNTYLSTTPAFTSPSPLCASSPLTIPVQITLSQFKLSGFVILVFSKAKGITLVFRNDPLESLKVSSTFDSIPFIANYLQKEIERQVRRIFQEDLPVAVHRLSLRLWNPEYAASLGNETTLPSRPNSPSNKDVKTSNHTEDEEIDYDYDPFSTGLDLDTADSSEDAIFSSTNLAHIESLAEAHNTLSLVTPKLRDVVFRAWACGANSGAQTIWDRPALDFLLPNGIDPAAAGGDENADVRSIASGSTSPVGHVRRPSLSTSTSAASISTLGASSRVSTPGATPLRRKKKHRVVNLRKSTASTTSSTETTPTSTADTSPCESSAASSAPDPVTPTTPTRAHFPAHQTAQIPPPPSFESVIQEDAPWPAPTQSDTKPIPSSHRPRPRNDSIDHDHPPRPTFLQVPTPSWSDHRRSYQPQPQPPQQQMTEAFISRLVSEMRAALKEEHLRRDRARGEKGDGAGVRQWGVERELERLERERMGGMGMGAQEGEMPPAYGA